MRQLRGLWVGASLLLVLAGCSNKNSITNVKGAYSPLITGLAIDHEPAVRGIPNHLTVEVTNVDGLPITYHWSAASGTMTDTTAVTSTWTAPDTIGTYDVTVSIQAQDGDNHYFKSMTFHVYVDNEYERWTRSEAIQFDPAPINGGGILFAEFEDNATGASAVYRVDTPGGGASQLTSGFFSAASPTPEANLAHFGFAGKVHASDAGPSIWMLPWAGGDTTNAAVIAARNPGQTYLGGSRFAHSGSRILYSSDTLSVPFPKFSYRDAENFNSPPIGLIQAGALTINGYPNPAWGPDVNADGFPDSVVAREFQFFGINAFQQSTGLWKFPTNVASASALPFLADTAAAEPDWSADGQYIVFAKKNDISGDRDIWIINAGSSNPADEVRITSGPADDSHPRFSEDGSKIYFVSNRADRYGLNGIFDTERRGTNIWSVSRFDEP
ncbi:MAG: hypothetical protein ACM3JJ_00360 [Hyphomicrobiales bacterium]